MNSTNGRGPLSAPPETSAEPTSSSSAERLATALEEYAARCRDGERPEREQFLAQYADIATALAECLDGLEFVESAAVNFAPREAADSDDPAPTTVLGDYQILQEVGRGGMGIVYEAQQLSLGRKVALKVLPLAAGLDPRRRQRFQLEAQAAAHLNHPHIVPIFAVGCDRGLHYFAMQFIDGHSLSDLIRQRRALAQPKASEAPEPDTPSANATVLLPRGGAAVEPQPPEAHGGSTPNPSDPRSGSTGTSARKSSSSQQARGHARAAATLAVQAAEALDHAHSLGIVHRDIKPSNLLVDGRGELWVTDFGLARIQDDVGPTRTGDIVGTLRYMSPEQASGGGAPVDHRTDVYSLGATLYELLTLAPPFQGYERAELLRRIATDEPAAPRKLEASIPRDLETIVLKAMAKEPERRYVTAQSLAEDLRRFLDERPVLARRPTPLEHAAKWARRHRTAVITAAVVLFLSMVTGGALLWRETRKTKAALGRLQLELASAEKRAATDGSLLKWFRLADDMVVRAMGLLVMQGQAGDAYSAAYDPYKKMAEELETNPQRSTLAGLAYHRVAFLRIMLQKPGADEAFRRSLELLKRGVAESKANAEPRVEMVRCLLEQATFSPLLPGYASAVDLTEQAVRVQASLVADDPSNVDSLAELTTDRAFYIERLRGAGQGADAERVTREEDAQLATHQAALRNDPQRLKRVAQAHLARGRQLAPSGGEEHRVVADRLFAVALRFDPENAEALASAAWLLGSQSRLRPHDPVRAIELARRAVAVEPASAPGWRALGVALFRHGERDEAVRALDQAIKRNRGEPDGTPTDWLVLAMAYHQMGQPDRAQELFARSSAWMVAKNSQDFGMRALHDEAAELLKKAPAR